MFHNHVPYIIHELVHELANVLFGFGGVQIQLRALVEQIFPLRKYKYFITLLGLGFL